MTPLLELTPLFAELRAHLADGNAVDACRLFHGRGHCFPGFESLVVDWFAPVALVTLFDEKPEPWLGELVGELERALGDALGGVLVQRRHLGGTPTETVRGSLPEQCWAREAGLSYRLRLGAGQNIGFFGDMGPTRAKVRELAGGRKVLNLFAYTCSFSVAAVAGGASSVVNVDMSRAALEVGRRNHLDNGQDPRLASFLAHDLFNSFGKLRRLGPYGVVVIDPPTNQGKSFAANRDWAKLLRQVPSLAAPGADVFAALNGPWLGATFLTDLVAEHLPAATLVEQLDGGPNYPECGAEAGLKVLHLRV